MEKTFNEGDILYASELNELVSEINGKQETLSSGENIKTVRGEDILGSGNIETDIPIVDKTSDSGTSFTLDPNKLYRFGEKTTLIITLGAETSGVMSEFMFEFVSGSTATTLNVPNTVKWIKAPSIAANKIYQVSIENNLGVIGEWS